MPFTPPDINMENTQVLRVHPEDDEELVLNNDDVQVLKIHDERDPDVLIEELMTTDTEAEQWEEPYYAAAQSDPQLYSLPQLSERPKRANFPSSSLPRSPMTSGVSVKARKANGRKHVRGPVLKTSLLRATSDYNLNKLRKTRPAQQGLPQLPRHPYSNKAAGNNNFARTGLRANPNLHDAAVKSSTRRRARARRAQFKQ